MNQKKFMVLAGAAVVALAAGVWISLHRSNQQGDLSGATVFADLEPALAAVEEIRVSRGDGSRSTLRKNADGWTVLERQYPADAARVRQLVLGLASLEVVERKTSDPANYARLGVEAPEAPSAGSTLVEVVAGKKTWALILGKTAEGRAVYLRKAAEAAALLAAPMVTADPDPKHWIDRLLVDIPGPSVHDIAVRPASGPAYLLKRANREALDLQLSPVPKGRTALSPMSLSMQAEALTAFNFDDVRARPATATPPTEVATYRTFDGAVIEFGGRREGEKAYVTLTARRDGELAAKFPLSPPAATAAAPPAAGTAAAPVPPTVPAPAADQTTEKITGRAQGVEYEIPAYKYETIFKKYDELLEKPASAAKPAAHPRPAH